MQNLSTKANENYHILLIAPDSEKICQLRADLQEHALKVLHLSNTITLKSDLITYYPDLILLTEQQEQDKGLSIVQIIRQQNAHANVPIFLLSDSYHPESAMASLCLGCYYTVYEPKFIKELRNAIYIWCRKSRRLSTLINKDSLTGLLNQRNLLAQLDHELLRAQRYPAELCFVMLDLDNFKKINDNYGHLGGDQILCDFAHYLHKRMRKTDTLSRYGGEEFAIIMPHTSAETAAEVLNEIRISVAAQKFEVNSSTIHISFSAGIARLEDINEINSQNLCLAADKALYKAKHNGRNQVVCYKDCQL